MADARELQYGIDFDTGEAGNTIDGMLSSIGALEQQFGAAEMGAHAFGVETVSACNTGQSGLEDFAGALNGTADASENAGSEIRTAADIAQQFGQGARAAGDDAEEFGERVQGASDTARQFGGDMRDAGDDVDGFQVRVRDAADSTGDLEHRLDDVTDEAERFRRSIRQTAEGAADLGEAFRETMADGLEAGQSIAKSFRTGLSGALDFSQKKIKKFGTETLKRVKGIGAAFKNPIKTIRTGLVEALRKAKEAEDDTGDAANDAEKDLDNMGEAGEDAGNKISQAITSAVAAFAGFEAVKKGIELLKGFASSALSAFASSETTSKKFGAMFTAETAEWVENFSDAVHRSKTEIQSFMVSNKALYSSMGITGEAAAELSKVTTSLAYDLGNAFSMEDAEALGVLQDYMSGNTAALEEFGVHIDDTVLKTTALKMGLGEDIDALDDAAMAQVRMNALLDNTAKIQQAAINSTGGLVNSTKSLKGELADFMTTAGERIAPVVEGLFGAILDEWPTLEPILLSFADALANGLGVAAPMLIQLGKDLIPGLSMALEALMSTLSPILGTLGSLAGTILPPLSNIIAEVASTALPPLVGIFQTLNESAIQPLMPVIEQVADQLLPVLGTALSAVSGAIGPLIAAFMPLLTSVLPVFGSLVSELAGAILPPLTKILGVVIQVIQPIVSVASSFVQATLPAVQPLISAIGTVLSDVVLPVVDALSPVLSFTAGVLGTIADALGQVIGWVSNGVGKVADFFGGLFGGAKESKTEVAELGQSFHELGTAAQNIKTPELNIPEPEVPEVPPIQVGVETAPLTLPALEDNVPAVTIPSELETPELPALETEPVIIPVSVEQPVIPEPEVEAVTLPVTVEKPVIPSPDLPKLPTLVLGAANTAPFSDSITKTTADANRQAVKSGDDIRLTYQGEFDRIGSHAGDVYNDIASRARSAWSSMASEAESGAKRVVTAFEKVGAAAKEIASTANLKIGASIPHNAAGTDNFPGGLTYMNEEGGELALLPSGTAIIPADKTDEIIRSSTSSNNAAYTDNSTMEIHVPITVYGGSVDMARELEEKVKEIFERLFEEKREADAHRKTIQYGYTIH